MLSIQDMAFIGAAALIFFGPEQLPKVARKVGLLVRDVQNTSQSFIREMERAGDTNSYHGPDISRAHLIEEAAGTTPAYTPPAYEPPHYEPYEPPAVHEPAVSEPHMADMFADYAKKEAPEASPVLHDIVAPRANGALGDHDLPP